MQRIRKPSSLLQEKLQHSFYRRPGIRHELGVGEQSVVTPFYDPMIAKLVVKGKDREEAIGILKDALAHYEVQGIKTNIPMLQKVVEHEAYVSGDTTTNFVEKYLQETKKNVMK
ncbi:hypothetical protein NDK43_08325 [Neobacillus pocheonensis]|uniref:biotin carboxylase n=1 Tax=Neobacillus pocheonensis TaxID=363869 RepID=A0ABT0W7T9_9BACI|nr:hypothetical protein [Neobacillus pocheonensis]